MKPTKIWYTVQPRLPESVEEKIAATIHAFKRAFPYEHDLDERITDAFSRLHVAMHKRLMREAAMMLTGKDPGQDAVLRAEENVIPVQQVDQFAPKSLLKRQLELVHDSLLSILHIHDGLWRPFSERFVDFKFLEKITVSTSHVRRACMVMDMDSYRDILVTNASRIVGLTIAREGGEDSEASLAPMRQRDKYNREQLKAYKRFLSYELEITSGIEIGYHICISKPAESEGLDEVASDDAHSQIAAVITNDIAALQAQIDNR